MPRSPCSALPMKIRNCWQSDPSSPSALISGRGPPAWSLGQHQVDRIAGEPAEEEHDRRHHEQQHDSLEQPMDDVALHGGCGRPTSSRASRRAAGCARTRRRVHAAPGWPRTARPGAVDRVVAHALDDRHRDPGVGHQFHHAVGQRGALRRIALRQQVLDHLLSSPGRSRRSCPCRRADAGRCPGRRSHCSATARPAGRRCDTSRRCPPAAPDRPEPAARTSPIRSCLSFTGRRSWSTCRRQRCRHRP